MLTAPAHGVTVTASPPTGATRDEFELRFCSLFVQGRALSFPCDCEGRVCLDTLSDQARENYLYARAVMGREYAYPEVVPAARH